MCSLDAGNHMFSLLPPSKSISRKCVTNSNFTQTRDLDKAKVVRALRRFAKERFGDFILQRAVASIESDAGGSTIDVGEAYNWLHIGARNTPDETVLAYYRSFSNKPPFGSEVNYREALRIIALDRRSNFLLREYVCSHINVQAGTATLGGLDNIGNTWANMRTSPETSQEYLQIQKNVAERERSYLKYDGKTTSASLASPIKYSIRRFTTSLWRLARFESKDAYSTNFLHFEYR
jgi:hypothetical protein